MAEDASLAQHSASGAKWLSMAKIVRILVTLATIAFLTRRLDAATFGLMALAVSMAMFAAILADLGIRQALIRKEHINDDEIASAFWLNLGIGATCSILVWVFADPISMLFDDPRVVWLMRTMAPIFVIGAVMGAPAALLERSMRFKAIALMELAAALSGSAAAVIAAASGAELGALVLQQYVTMGLTTLGVWIFARFVPRTGFRWPAVRPLLSFGLYISMADLAQFGANNLNRPVIASAISAEALGPLAIAQQIVYGPMQTITQAVGRVVYPALASIVSDQARLQAAQRQGMHFIMFLVAPVCTGLIAISTPMVAVLMGPGWETVPTLLSLYAVQAMMIGIITFNGPLIKALGRSDVFFALDLVASIAVVMSLFLALPYGVLGIMIGRVGVAVGVAVMKSLAGCHLINQSPRNLLKAVAAPILNATAMMLLLIALQSRLSLSDGATLALCIPLGVALYVGLAFTFDRTIMMQVAALLLNRTRKPASPSGSDSNAT